MIAHLYIAYHNVMILVESCYNKLSPTISDTKELGHTPALCNTDNDRETLSAHFS